jgi:hypothetical protein
LNKVQGAAGSKKRRQLVKTLEQKGQNSLLFVGSRSSMSFKAKKSAELGNGCLEPLKGGGLGWFRNFRGSPSQRCSS